MPKSNQTAKLSKIERERELSNYEKAFAELKAKVIQCPVNLPSQIDLKTRAQLDTYTTKMVYDVAITTGAGAGEISPVFGSSPTTASNWATAASFFDEYRVLAVKLEYRPNWFATGATTVILAPISSVIDLDTSGNLTSYTAAAQYSSVKETRGMMPFTRFAYMSGPENSQFLSTAAPVNTINIKVYSSGNPASTVIGRFVQTFYIQFRGKGI